MIIELFVIAITISIVLWFFGVKWELVVSSWVSVALIAGFWTGAAASIAWMLKNWFGVCGC